MENIDMNAMIGSIYAEMQNLKGEVQALRSENNGLRTKLEILQASIAISKGANVSEEARAYIARSEQSAVNYCETFAHPTFVNQDDDMGKQR